jgi:hypothetical protein
MILSKYQQLCLTSLSLIIGTVGIISLQKNNLQAKLTAKEQTSYIEEEQILKATINIQKKLPTFGFNNLIADWNYLQFIQYFGDVKAREVTGYPLVTDYFEVAVNKDPLFTQAFLSFSAANSLFAARPDKTVALIDKALESASPDLQGYPFLLWTYKAADEILFLGDLEAAKNSYEMAARWARWRNDDLGNEMAKRYNKTAQYLASDPDPTSAQFGAWMSILSGSQDRKTQDYILNQLKSLGAEINITPDGKLEIKPPNQA